MTSYSHKYEDINLHSCMENIQNSCRFIYELTIWVDFYKAAIVCTGAANIYKSKAERERKEKSSEIRKQIKTKLSSPTS